MADIDIPFGSGDTGPVVRRTLRNGDGTPVNLTGATVKFLYSKVVTSDESAPQLEVACSLPDAANGVVDFTWPGVTAPRGISEEYTGQYKATLQSGAVMHFPNFPPLLQVVVTGEP